jgi:hypothetical protein
MPSNLPAPVNTGQVKACVFRVAALGPNCAPLGGDCSGYVGAGLVNYTADPQIEEGVERRPRNGCGRVLYTVKDDDIITSWNLSGEIAVWDPEMLVLMFGGEPILGAPGGDFAGSVIGWASPSPDSPARNGVYFEVIAEQVAEGAGDCVAAGAEYPPYVGDVWGKVRFTPGQITRNNDDAYVIQFTGSAVQNPSLYNGPWNDWPGVTNGSPYIPNTPYSYVGYTEQEYNDILALVAPGCQDLPSAS